jgi:hypothetical protein
MLEWESLTDALRRVVGIESTREAAKKVVCDHISQDIIRVRVLPLGSERFITGRKGVEVPQVLKPSDLDWGRSRPKRPWRIDFSHGRYGWELHDIARLELSTFDTQWRLGDVPDAPRKNEASGNDAAPVPKPQVRKFVRNYIETENAEGRKPTQDGAWKTAQSQGIGSRTKVHDAFKDEIEFPLERGRPTKIPKK